MNTKCLLTVIAIIIVILLCLSYFNVWASNFWTSLSAIATIIMAIVSYTQTEKCYEQTDKINRKHILNQEYDNFETFLGKTQSVLSIDNIFDFCLQCGDFNNPQLKKALEKLETLQNQHELKKTQIIRFETLSRYNEEWAKFKDTYNQVLNEHEQILDELEKTVNRTLYSNSDNWKEDNEDYTYRIKGIQNKYTDSYSKLFYEMLEAGHTLLRTILHDIN